MKIQLLAQTSDGQSASRGFACTEINELRRSFASGELTLGGHVANGQDGVRQTSELTP